MKIKMLKQSSSVIIFGIMNFLIKKVTDKKIINMIIKNPKYSRYLFLDLDVSQEYVHFYMYNIKISDK